jgi:hypothetical protein
MWRSFSAPYIQQLNSCNHKENLASTKPSDTSPSSLYIESIRPLSYISYSERQDLIVFLINTLFIFSLHNTDFGQLKNLEFHRIQGF